MGQKPVGGQLHPAVSCGGQRLFPANHPPSIRVKHKFAPLRPVFRDPHLQQDLQGGEILFRDFRGGWVASGG